MTNPALVVPVELDALIVNKGVLSRDAFRQWQFNYQALPQFKSPEPEAFDRSTTGQQPGVYLHWTLPSALRHGAGPSGDTYPLVPNRWLLVRFNGQAQRQVTAWVIESDCPFSSQVKTGGVELSSLYLVDPTLVAAWKNSKDPYRNAVSLDPSSTGPQVANIGIRFPLAAGWQERAEQPMFLTAMAPANPAFSIYTAHNAGVFSFYDDLSGIDADTLSYLVVGWYSDPNADVLASWQSDTTSQDPYGALLGTLGWTVTGGSETQATTSLYEGMTLGLAWERNGDPPAADPLQAIRDSGLLNVAIGNTTIDAFSALLASQLAAKGHDPQTTELLRAFQYDLLPILDQVNGDAILEETIRKAWFGGAPGGYRWTTVPAGSDGGPADAAETDVEPWLLVLNQNQAALDAALGELFTLQWRLNELWYKYGFLDVASNTFPTPPAGVGNVTTFRQALAAELDPAGTGVASQVVAKLASVKALLAQVPQPIAGSGTAQDAFQRGVQAFGTQQGLAVTRVLKAVAGPRYYQPNNPVVLFSGVEPAAWAGARDSLDVRLASHLVTGFNAGTAVVSRATAGGAIPALANVAALPSAVPALLDECFLLDPANASALAGAVNQPLSVVSSAMTAHDPAAYLGPLPDLPLANGSQPWKPMYMDWKVQYTHIPYQGNWVFDGTDYHFDSGGKTPAVEDRLLGGVSLLSASAQTVFGSRLGEFVQKYGQGTALADLYGWIGDIDDWKFLNQELVGFNSLLALRDTRAFRRPTSTDTLGSGNGTYSAADLIGYGGTSGPAALPSAYQGHVGSTPYLPNGPAIPFHGARHGQIFFTDLLLYDKFGRVLFVVQSSSSSGLFDKKNFPVLQGEALAPATKVHTEILAVSELAPRALQNARLDFQLVDGLDDAKLLGAVAGVNPVAGWVLPNHLDKSVLLYAPDGEAVGELRLVVNAAGIKTAEWQPPPHSQLTTLDEVATVAPHIAQMLGSSVLSTEASFLTFLQTIDETLWTVDPLGARVDQNLSVLVGRPLALVRAQLQLTLEGEPLADTGWANTADPPAADIVGYDFCVRLGDQATREDGVIGYFTGSNYNVFNSVVAPDTTVTQDYVQQIGPRGPGGGQNYPKLRFDGTTSVLLTLLVDPRASMHATTGILPVKEVTVPSQFVTPALARLEIGFRMGPILTPLAVTPAQGGVTPAHPQAVSYPSPAEQNGTWSWWEKDAAANAWVGFDLLDTTTNAQLKNAPNTLREGVLQLVLDLNQDQAQKSA